MLNNVTILYAIRVLLVFHCMINAIEAVSYDIDVSCSGDKDLTRATTEVQQMASIAREKLGQDDRIIVFAFKTIFKTDASAAKFRITCIYMAGSLAAGVSKSQ